MNVVMRRTKTLIRLAREHRWQQIRRRIEDLTIRRAALAAMIRRTDNFYNVPWLGVPLWQNVTDAWLLQEAIVEDSVDLVIECGTNRGGSAYFIGTIFDLLGRGSIVTIDVEKQREVDHPRVEYLIGSSTDPGVVATVRQRVSELNPEHILVFLDSDHSQAHVERELAIYSELVGIGDYVCVQDGCIDELRMLRTDRPGPLRAIETFIRSDDRFEVDEERSGRYLVSHSPKGWLRRVR
jgi:cephalosporin hydroxylase